MKKYMTVFLFMVCLIIAGCGDSYSAGNSSHGIHYSQLIDRAGEPDTVIKDGTGGFIMSYDPVLSEDDLQSGSFNSGNKVYRVNANGYVYGH